MVAAQSAVRPGTDLPRHARLMAAVHDAVLAGARPPARPRDLVARSWSRVRAGGLAPDRCGTAEPVGPAEVQARRRRSLLREVVPELRSALAAFAEDARFVVVVTDADGVLLWREGSAAVRRQADALGFAEGADWSEGSVGTNAIGTALVERAPVQLFSAEHYAPSHHPWTCTASPVHDPRTGELLGVVDVSGPALTLTPTTIALVSTAVRLAEATLWRSHEERLERLRTVADPVLAGVRGPAMVVDEHGWVARSSGLAVRDRVAAPAADRPLAVAGLGLCVPEPVAGGWLLRRGDDPAGGAVRVTLDLRGHPEVAVSGAGEPWRRAVTPRHAEVLALLARAGREGLDAAALSRALHGDAGHVVAVRAEISRLRRTLGGLLAAQPYRFAEGVTVEVVGGEGVGGGPGVSASSAATARPATAPR
ncbi:GAF domain-containing protein [Rhodococcus aerolatus]